MSTRMIITLMLASPFLVGCSASKKPLSDTWGAGEERITFREDYSVEGVIHVTIAEKYEILPLGQSYAEEVDGRPVDGWRILAGKEPCMVTIITSSGEIELSSKTASISPYATLLEKVKDTGINRQYLGTVDCNYYEKIPFNFGRGGTGFNFGRSDVSTDKKNGGTIYRKLTSGLLRFEGNYAFTEGIIEVRVSTLPSARMREHVLLRFRLSRDKMILLANEAYVMEEKIYEKRSS